MRQTSHHRLRATYRVSRKDKVHPPRYIRNMHGVSKVAGQCILLELVSSQAELQFSHVDIFIDVRP